MHSRTQKATEINRAVMRWRERLNVWTAERQALGPHKPGRSLRDFRELQKPKGKGQRKDQKHEV